jgi:serine/threonine protein kinase/tetratricopeptide (TPR) repeat protein
VDSKTESDKRFRASASPDPATESVDLDDPLLRELAQAPARTAELPEAIGPYRVIEPLGRGGMGMVYRAVHGQTGQSVALKTVRVPDQKVLASIRREIRTLAGIRHTGIVRIVAEGLHQGLPWYAMELLEGITLRRQLAAAQAPPGTEPTARLSSAQPAASAWWTHSLLHSGGRRAAGGERSTEGPSGPRPAARGPALPELLALVRHLCAPLAYLHGEGLVHRDLKPENILITGSREAQEPFPPPASCLLPSAFPVLVDFGLASQSSGELSRDVLQVEDSVMGTAMYMAPEQVRGGLVDARADLYALGCILYELVTGRPPFAAETPEELLRKHLQQPPERPSHLGYNGPEELEELILRLLAKNPQERLGYAEDVARALGRLGVADGGPASAPKPRPYLYRPRFTGRSAPLQALGEALGRAREGQGGLVLVSGESGVGKTRLLMEFGQQAARHKGIVLSGEGLEMRRGPLEALRGPLHALADRCREQGQAESDRLFGTSGRLLARYEPAIAALLEPEEHPEPAEIPADAAQLRLFRALTRTFSALAQQPPLLLMLDDLQWADELTLGFLEHVLRAGRLERKAWLIVGAYRTEEVGTRDRAPLQGLIEAPGAVRLPLGRLDAEALGDLVSGMLALDAPPREFVRFLLSQSEGNPFFVAEYLRTAVAEGLLVRDELGRWQVAQESDEPAPETVYKELPLPRSVQQLVGRRLEGLSTPARRLVDAAVVVGREAAAPLIGSIARLDTSALLEASAEVLRRQVLEEAGGGALRFAHDKLREVAYESLTPAQRLELHRAAATGIETLYAGQLDEQAAALGHHWEQAQEPAKAQRHYLAGARRARDRHAFDEAERLYRAVLRLAQRPQPQSVQARYELAWNVLHVRGRNHEALAELEAAAQEAHQIADRPGRLQALSGLGGVVQVLGEVLRAQELYGEALHMARAEADRPMEARLLSQLAQLHQQQGRMEAAQELYLQALELSRASGSRTLEGQTLTHLASHAYQQGQMQESQGLFEQALRVLRELGERRLEGIALNNLAAVHREQGRIEAAADLYRQALDIARAVGERRLEAQILVNLSVVQRDRGQNEEAFALLEAALAIHREAGDKRAEAHNLGSLALAHAFEGRIEEALALLHQALRLTQAVGDPRQEGAWRLYLGRLQRLGGRFDEAEVQIEAAMGLLRKAENRYFLAVALCDRGHCALARQQTGRPWLDEAARIAEQLGAAATSELGSAVARLARAQAAVDAGRPERLFRGEPLDDLPEGVRRWLAQTGQWPMVRGQ